MPARLRLRRRRLGRASRAHQDMTVGAGASAAAAAGTDIGLLDAAAVHVDLGQRSSIAILAMGSQHYGSGFHDPVQSPFGGVSARLVEFGRVDVRQPDLPVVAHQRVAIDRDASLQRRAKRSAREKNNEKREPHAVITPPAVIRPE
jgi:hypothetical protein